MNIGQYELNQPFMNAGGLVRSVPEARLMAATAVGAVLGGSFTLDTSIGNSPNGEVVYYHDPVTHATYNCLGMPNPGSRLAASDFNEMLDIAHAARKPFILNFAPITADPVQEVIALSQLLIDANVETLDAIELNASCPNVVTEDGGRHEPLSYHPERLARVLFELSDIRHSELPFGTLMVRISPFRHKAEAQALVSAVVESGTQVVTAFNTFPGHVPTTPEGEKILQVAGGIGGKSGMAMASAAEEQTVWLTEARAAADADFDIIGSTGIGNGETMKRRLELGVAAVSGTTLFYENPKSWSRSVRQLLDEYHAELLR